MINKVVDYIFYEITYYYGKGKCDGTPKSGPQLFIVYFHIVSKYVQFEDQNINYESDDKRENGEPNELVYCDWHCKVKYIIGNEIGYEEGENNCNTGAKSGPKNGSVLKVCFEGRHYICYI